MVNKSIFFCVDYFNKYTIYFSNPKSWIMWGIIELHDYLMFFLINIFVLVSVFIFINMFIQQNYFKNKEFISNYVKFDLSQFNHAPLLEFFWTIVPALILAVMAWPSIKLLYAMEQLIDPLHTVNIIGNQWYRTYQYSDFDIASDIIMQLDSKKGSTYFKKLIKITNNSFLVKKEEIDGYFFNNKVLQYLGKQLRKYDEVKIMYDSVIISDENLPLGYPRLLSADQVLVLPSNISMRLLVTSTDVIHSWALPSHGIKMDAIPGRINQIPFISPFWGTYWGQCSELCGINHGFMPIEVRVIPVEDYILYIKLNISVKYDKFAPTAYNIIKSYLNFIKLQIPKNKCLELNKFFF